MQNYEFAGLGAAPESGPMVMAAMVFIVPMRWDMAPPCHSSAAALCSVTSADDNCSLFPDLAVPKEP
jgi:hypothetical protein